MMTKEDFIMDWAQGGPELENEIIAKIDEFYRYVTAATLDVSKPLSPDVLARYADLCMSINSKRVDGSVPPFRIYNQYGHSLDIRREKSRAELLDFAAEQAVVNEIREARKKDQGIPTSVITGV